MNEIANLIENIKLKVEKAIPNQNPGNSGFRDIENDLNIISKYLTDMTSIEKLKEFRQKFESIKDNKTYMTSNSAASLREDREKEYEELINELLTYFNHGKV